MNNKPPVTMSKKMQIELGLSNETMAAHSFVLDYWRDVWIQCNNKNKWGK